MNRRKIVTRPQAVKKVQTSFISQLWDLIVGATFLTYHNASPAWDELNARIKSVNPDFSWKNIPYVIIGFGSAAWIVWQLCLLAWSS
jgi:hypothetical protein